MPWGRELATADAKAKKPVSLKKDNGALEELACRSSLHAMKIYYTRHRDVGSASHLVEETSRFSITTPSDIFRQGTLLDKLFLVDRVCGEFRNRTNVRSTFEV